MANKTFKRERSSWGMMIQRCTNPNATRYDLYGGRGIKVCDRWLAFHNFYEDMGPRPPNTSIDRIERDKDYEPGNCRWSTQTAQNRNKINNVRYKFEDGSSLTAAEAAEKYGKSKERLEYKLPGSQRTPTECLDDDMTITKQHLSARQFRKWMDSLSFGTIDAAEALGLKARAIQRYLDGTRPVSKTTALAMAAISGKLEAWRG